MVTLVKGDFAGDGGVIAANNVRVQGDPGLTFVKDAAGNLQGVTGSGTHIFGGTQLGGQAVIVVLGNGCVLKNLEISGGLAGDDCNAVRQSGADLIIDTCWLHDNNMHIQSGGPTGDLSVKNGLLENTVYGGALAHGIYCGGNSKGTALSFHLTDTTVRNSTGDGHLVKSRAMTTVITGCTLAQMDGVGSRVIDIPDGGQISITKNTLELGRNSDNGDAIGLALELIGDSYAQAIGAEPLNDPGAIAIVDLNQPLQGTLTLGSDTITISAADAAGIAAELVDNPTLFIRAADSSAIWNPSIYNSAAALVKSVGATSVQVQYFDNANGFNATKATVAGPVALTLYSFKPNPARTHAADISGNAFIVDLAANPHGFSEIDMIHTRLPVAVTASGNTLVGNPTLTLNGITALPVKVSSFDANYFAGKFPASFPSTPAQGTVVERSTITKASRADAGVAPYPALPAP